MVLGAGASWPYGFPTGRELIDTITHLEVPGIKNEAGTLEFNRKECEEFQESLRLANPPSIDIFLKHRPSLARYGKLLIASALTANESVTGQDNNYVREVRGSSDDWYQYLWGELSAGANSPEDLLKNNLSFVTFNYDKSLENYLFHACKNLYDGCTNEQALRFIDHLNIIHVFGTTGGDPGGRDFRSYKSSLQGIGVDVILEIAKSLLTIGEAESFETSHLLNIRKAISISDRLIILGFGYHPENMEILGLQNAVNSNRGVQLYFSACGVAPAYLDHIEHQLKMSGQVPFHWPVRPYTSKSGLRSLKNLEFLVETGALVSA